MLTRVDEWAERVRVETAKYYHRYESEPEAYDNSEAQYRMIMLITVLMQDLGVRYNPERIDNVDFTRSGDLFLYGLLSGDGGTCVSMPVLYVAVGRRLGYPLRLVEGPEHLFLRWEDPQPGERFNIEGTSRGFLTKPDEYYESWPRPMTEAEKGKGYFLKALTAQEELAVFLTTRAHALFDLGKYTEAERTYDLALRLSPQNIPACHERRGQHTKDAAHGCWMPSRAVLGALGRNDGEQIATLPKITLTAITNLARNATLSPNRAAR